ncbi:DUF3109 family protein [Fulvivirgaceae bacterium BMA10]|uniref:DUF3109 family protein n=1 Tax=Splendidivirga corallicola TaxID=3051826 RepID=A0ABT8KL08_9BACT|nr:DUF3109 family protein [Fulvivirgaceae bacterium BMA10]
MIVLDNTIISDEIKEQLFVCDLKACKGACCVEGDLGAPLDEDELEVMEDIYDEVEPYLSDEGKAAIEKQGSFILDEEGDFSTPTINGKECAYAIYDESGILKCGIEQAYLEGKIHFRKPISCHLYPIRISKYDEYDAINYSRWSICSSACTLGQELGVPLYKFLKEALIRKYGEDWYQTLVEVIENPQATEENE